METEELKETEDSEKEADVQSQEGGSQGDRQVHTGREKGVVQLEWGMVPIEVDTTKEDI